MTTFFCLNFVTHHKNTSGVILKYERRLPIMMITKTDAIKVVLSNSLFTNDTHSCYSTSMYLDDYP